MPDIADALDVLGSAVVPDDGRVTDDAGALDRDSAEVLREILTDPPLPVGGAAAGPDGARRAALREALDYLGSRRLAAGATRSAGTAAGLVSALASVHDALAQTLRWHATLAPVLAGLAPGRARDTVLGDILRGDLVTWATHLAWWAWAHDTPPAATDPIRRASAQLRVDAFPGLFDAIVVWEPRSRSLVAVPTYRDRVRWEADEASAGSWTVHLTEATFHAFELIPVAADPRSLPGWHEF